jgi:hypothetical protein
MQRTFAQAGAKAHATIVAPPAGRVAAGHVLRAIDLLYRAGFESVQFQGQGAPQPLLGPESAKGDWLREYVKKNPPMKPGYSLKVGNVHVVGQAGATPVPLPPAPPRRSATPAEGATPNEVVPAGEESAAAGTPTAGPAEDPVKVDVGSEMPSESPVPARRRGAFGGRRDALAQGPGPGGQSKKDPAVLHALRWLALHQSENGGWEAAGFDRWCEGKLSEVDRPDGQGDRDYDVGVTGLALGAFLGAGYTNRGDHEFAKVVRKGLAYLKGVQDKDGCYGRRPSPHFVYNHAAAALAMVEAYGMTESPVFRGSAQKAVEFLMAARNPRRAWRYGVKPGDDDTSVTGWMTMVLQSARLINTELARAGKPLVFPKDDEAFAGVQAWLDAVTDPATGRVGYLARGTGPSRETSRVAAFPPEKSEATTAIGLLARVFLSEDAASSDTVKKGLDLCANLPPTWDTAAGTIDLCYWYFGTMAVFQLGGEPWSRWERALDTALIPAQRMDGNYCGFKGSWDPIDAWGPDGGRVYSTSMACMCLEVIHRYDRLAAKDR